MGKHLKSWKWIVAALLLSGPLFAKSPTAPADVLITHARIYTVHVAQPWAQAIAVRGDKIIFVGSDAAALKYRGPNTKVINAGGRLLLPGFTDSHVHFMDGSLSLGRVNLEGTKNVAEMQARIKEYAAAHPDATWILGRGWSYPEFGAEALPHKKYLDEIVPDRPVFMEGYDGHTYWANSKALAAAGIDRNSPEPPNGSIVRDKDGEPTGALKEFAGDLVTKVVPPLTKEERLTALRAGVIEANRVGVVRIHSCGGDFEHLPLFDELRKNGQLTVRIYMGYFLDPPALTPEALDKIEAVRKQYKNDWISGGAVKTMLDGVVESHTAAMLGTYADNTALTGSTFWQPEAYKKAITELDKRGFQIFTHAIGDAAVRLALDAYEGAAQANGTTDARPRIEHIETITADDIPRFGKLGVIASFQPLHAYPDEDTLTVWLRNAGKDREPRAWAWQSIAKKGGRLAFGSDWPVVTINPWAGVQNAVTRETIEGGPKGGWVPEQKLTMEQAIHGYTLGAAYGGRRDKSEGSLEPGKLADMILLSQDLFKIDPHDIVKTAVLWTMVGGEIVYESQKWKEITKAATEKSIKK